MKAKIKLTQEVKEITLQDGADLFLKEKKFLNISEETIKTYMFTIEEFKDFLGAESSCYDICIDSIYNFVDFKKELARKRYDEAIAQGKRTKQRARELSDNSINTYITNLRVFLYFLMKNEYVEKFEIKNIKVDEVLKEPYTDAEIEILLKKPDLNECEFAVYRTWVIINYLIGTGNRLNTVCNVKINEIDFDSGHIVLSKLKGRKQYIIPLSPTLAEILKEYLKYRNGEPDDYLFCNQYGGQLNKTSMESAIRRYNLSRGIAKTGVHLFRHYFAKSYILNGGDPFRLQRLLGHRTLDMTRKYVNMYSNDLAKGFEEFNPLDNISKSRTKRKALKMK